MGASTGHTAVALWRDGGLQVSRFFLHSDILSWQKMFLSLLDHFQLLLKRFGQYFLTDLWIQRPLTLLADEWSSMQRIFWLAWGERLLITHSRVQTKFLTSWKRYECYFYLEKNIYVAIWKSTSCTLIAHCSVWKTRRLQHSLGASKVSWWITSTAISFLLIIHV